ncbi:hypothetical protein MNBD_GAMMA10-2734 [hydrothermal vent metagenome]|uniref:Uncharacterized protein n=1 Tax=hydrothermal vent metagenome TaxID=652676 RepID=A0A3B0XPM5_9ZZZZ
MRKKHPVKHIAALTLIYSASSSAAYITETLDPNDDFSSAQFISSSVFTTEFDNDIDASPNFPNDPTPVNISTSIPHASILGTGDNTVDYFAFQAGQGRLVLDIDYAIDADYDTGYGNSFNSRLELYDSSFNLLRSDNGASQKVDEGSYSNLFGTYRGLMTSDSFIDYQITTGDLYYVVVSSIDNPLGIIPARSDYTLHISNTPVPVPASVWLFISGVLGLFGVCRKRGYKGP